VALSGCALIAGLRDPDHVDEEIQLPDARPAGDASSEASPGPGPPPPCAADLTSDANHCGWCGHACGGAACRGGLCEPTRISTADPSALAADDERVFYIADDEVSACSALGPELACRGAIDVDAAWSLLRSGGREGRPLPEPAALSLHGDRVFVLDEGYRAVISCPTSHCDAASVGVVDIPGSTDPTGSLAVGSTQMFWGEPDGIGTADVPAPARVTPAALLAAPVAASSWRIHVADFGSGRREVLWLNAGGLFALDLRGGAPSEVVPGRALADFAVDVASIYVASGSRVERIDRATSVRSLVANLGDVAILSLVADAGGVFALVKTGIDERVVRVHEGGSVPIAVASDIDQVAFSKSWLYYAGAGGIFRVSR
jgi:hypothetical protein